MFSYVCRSLRIPNSISDDRVQRPSMHRLLLSKIVIELSGGEFIHPFFDSSVVWSALCSLFAGQLSGSVFSVSNTTKPFTELPGNSVVVSDISGVLSVQPRSCLLYTSDAADE
eukprot:8354791-Heterocapsa_arctica.AAC.1